MRNVDDQLAELELKKQELLKEKERLAALTLEQELAAFMEENPNLSHVAMPKIGAGLGGGDWNIIESIINTNMKDVKVVVYEL